MISKLQMATHSSILAWRIPWTEKSGGLYSPWGRKESDMTERLHLFNLLIFLLGLILIGSLFLPHLFSHYEHI